MTKLQQTNIRPHRPIHTYNDGKPYRLAGGRDRPRNQIENLCEPTHSAVTGKPTPAEFVKKIKREFKIRCYARNSIKNYMSHLLGFLRWYGNSPHLVNQEHVRCYLEILVDGGASSSHLSGCISAIRTAFDKFCRRDVTLGIATPRRPRKKPVILSPEEVTQVLKAAPTPAIKLAIGIMYAVGLRNSELCKLSVADIDFDRNTIRVDQGKGNSDRLVMLPRSFRKVLERECADRAGTEYLFPSLERRRNRYMSPRTLQRWVKLAVRLSSINKPVTPHTFRHAFATHLLENGTDIRFIQKLLGHQRLETTTIYTHVAKYKSENVVSPLDRLADSGGLSGEVATNKDEKRIQQPQSPPAVGSLLVHLKPVPQQTAAQVTVELLQLKSSSSNPVPRKFLTGMMVSLTSQNWVQLTLPEAETWEPVLATLAQPVRDRIKAPEFYESLRRAVSTAFLQSGITSDFRHT